MKLLRKVLLSVLVFCLLSIVVLEVSFRLFSLAPPELETEQDDTENQDHSSYYAQNSFGLWEAYVEGAPYARCEQLGKLAKSQVQEQEEHFIAQIRRLVPSEVLLRTLKYGVSFFNRNMNDHVPLEYQQEISGISAAFNTDNDWIAPAYARVMNYHAAHDIGHALQDLSIVGCTSFAAWDAASADSTLIIGRNFDFYMGDDFAKDKLVLFLRPDSGYAFASITWAGFMGVVSGMNEHGLVVTLNAAKSSVPTGSKTPISILAREILQYARTIDEAYAIAKSRQTFVSESILIGSAADGRAAIIEKSPDAIGLFTPSGNTLVSSNHYQGEPFVNDSINVQNIRLSDSNYRFRRMSQLLEANLPITPAASAAMLRDQKGMDGANLGMGNPKAINQLLAHHGVVFQPEKRLMWVSANPFQLGELVCYDLNKIFKQNGAPFSNGLSTDSLNILADPFLESQEYEQFLHFKATKQRIFDFLVYGRGTDLTPTEEQAFLASNPKSYITHQLLGELQLNREQNAKAAIYFKQALALEVASENDRAWLRDKIKEAEED